MMTRKRLQALTWLHENPGAIDSFSQSLWPRDAPSRKMIDMMYYDGQVDRFRDAGLCLTDQGRQDLHEATQ